MMGDWNADMLDSESSDSRFVHGLIGELSLKLVKTGPSHHTASKHSWIDILLTDNNDIVISHDRKLTTFPSRHDVICVTIETFHPELPIGTYTCRGISKIKPDNLRLILLNKHWTAYSLPENEFYVEQVF